MEEFHQSVKATLYERAKKPFTGTFILAWIACNWKLLVAILFINEADLDGITRIGYIEEFNLLESDNLVWNPFLITVVALVLFGILNILASWLVLQFKNFQFTYIDKRTKIDAADYGKLLDALKNIEDKWAEEIESINSSRVDLKKSNNEYAIQLKKLNNKVEKLEGFLNLSEQKISKSLGESKNEKDKLRLESESYKAALLKASELLDRYIEDHGTIKKSVPLSAIMNKIQKRKELNEMIQDIDKAYENFKK